MTEQDINSRKGKSLGRMEEDMHAALVLTKNHYGTTSIKYIERRMLADPVFRANLKTIQAQKGTTHEQDSNINR